MQRGLFKTHIVVWSEGDLSEMSFAEVGRASEDGLAVLDIRDSEFIDVPEEDEEWSDDVEGSLGEIAERREFALDSDDDDVDDDDEWTDYSSDFDDIEWMD